MKRLPPALVLASALAAALSATVSRTPSAAAQPPASPAAEPQGPELFVERVDVNLVNVEVWVADRSGNRVTGLTRDDFEVYEDGRPVEITNFYTEEWSDALLPRQDGSGWPTDLAPRRRRPPDQQLNLVIFIDHAHIFPSGQRRILDQLEGFLEDRLIEGDNLMLVAYDRSFKVIEPFTTDRHAVSDALRRLRKVSALGAMREAQRRQTMLSMSSYARVFGESGDLTAVRTAEDMIKSYIQSVDSDLDRTAEAFDRTLRSLAGLPGRRALLYVGGGLDQRPGEELYQYLQDLFGLSTLRSARNAAGGVLDPSIEALRNDKTLLYNAVIRAANANQVTLYTLDASGTQGHSTLGAEHSGAFIGASDAGRTTLDGMRQDNLIEPLIALASATGGTAVVNTSNFDDALAGLASDFDTYYSLGYPAPNSGDGVYHKIEVRLKRPGLSVRHRQGYVDRSPEERVADRTLSSLLLDLESNPLEVSLDFGEPQRQGKKRYRLPVMVRIPVDHVTLLDTGGTREGRLKIFLVVKDDEGGVSDLHRHAYPLNIPNERLVDALQREIGYYATLEVRPGRPVVAVGVWDELAGSESFVQKRVLVGDTATAGR